MPIRFAYISEPPFGFNDIEGRPTGCDVELAIAVSGVLGISLQPIKTEFVDLLLGLADGRWDMTTGLFVTSARQRIAAFSRPIWTLGDGLLVQSGNPLKLSGYQSVAVKGAKLAVVQDQIQHHTALSANVAPAVITVFPNYEKAAEAVATGVVDAYASVARAHRAHIAQSRQAITDLVEVSATEHPPAVGAFAMRLRDTGLKSDVDRALAAFLGSRGHVEIAERFGLSMSEYLPDRELTFHSAGGLTSLR
jgi:polar amino acid transport system substrate-binding protein